MAHLTVLKVTCLVKMGYITLEPLDSVFVRGMLIYLDGELHQYVL